MLHGLGPVISVHPPNYKDCPKVRIYNESHLRHSLGCRRIVQVTQPEDVPESMTLIVQNIEKKLTFKGQ